MNALVSWNPAPEPNVTEYHVFHGHAPDTYVGTVAVVPVPTTQSSWTGLDDYKTHYFAVTAYNSALLESLKSAEVSKRLTHRLTLK